MPRLAPMAVLGVARVRARSVDGLGDARTVIATGSWIVTGDPEPVNVFVTNKHVVDPRLKDRTTPFRTERIEIELREKRRGEGDMPLPRCATEFGFYLAWAAIGSAHAGALYEPAFAAIAKWFPSPVPRDRALLAVTTVAGFASTIFVPLTAAAHGHLGRAPAVLLLALLTGVFVVR